MTDDSQTLLAEYAKSGSEPAFQELVSRYVNLVYSTALRLVGGDSHLAEDVAQTVFIALASKGRRLSSQVMLGGWLHQYTFHVATKLVRSERRRQSRERVAVEMDMLHQDSQADWRRVAPVLDEAITQLEREDRLAIVLRYFEQRDLRGVGKALGKSEDAARMRVNRALEKLHSLLKRQGVGLSLAGLGTLLTSEAVSAAPPGLASALSAAALAAGASAAGTTFTIVKLMSATKLKLALVAVLLAGTVGSLIQHQAQAKLRRDNAALRRRISLLENDNENLSRRFEGTKATRALRLPAPPIQVPLQAPPVADPLAPNLAARLNSKDLKLTSEQVESFLAANGRHAGTLLAAFRTSGNEAFLEEAMQRYPNDPQVGFAAALQSGASPEERRQWLEAFKSGAPENSLADYLSALDYLRAGQMDKAVQDLIAADGKSGFQDYAAQRIQDDQDAFLSTGCPLADAQAAAVAQEPLMPSPGDLRRFARAISDLANGYQQAGDAVSAQAARHMIVHLGQRYSNGAPGEFLVSQNIGLELERFGLAAMDPNSVYDDAGHTVQVQLSQINQRLAAQRQLGQQTTPLRQAMSDQDWIRFNDRLKTFGEAAACRWLMEKTGSR